MNLTPEQEEEVRLAWSFPPLLPFNYPYDIPTLKFSCEEEAFERFRSRYIAAKGWDKEGEK